MVEEETFSGEECFWCCLCLEASHVTDQALNFTAVLSHLKCLGYDLLSEAPSKKLGLLRVVQPRLEAQSSLSIGAARFLCAFLQLSAVCVPGSSCPRARAGPEPVRHRAAFAGTEPATCLRCGGTSAATPWDLLTRDLLGGKQAGEPVQGKSEAGES